MNRFIQWMRGEEPPQDDVPMCDNHHVPMVLFKKVGKPTRFSDQETETYTLLYRCPVPGCDESAERRRIRNQIPVPGELTARPAYAARERRSI
jgi:hypothetical protein